MQQEENFKRNHMILKAGERRHLSLKHEQAAAEGTIRREH